MYRELAIMSRFNHANIVNFKVSLLISKFMLILITHITGNIWWTRWILCRSWIVCHSPLINHSRTLNVNRSFILVRITGGELFDRIVALQRYSENEASHVMCQALLGLKHMHEKGVVHRDIKVWRPRIFFILLELF
jgi:serine/threonine protein kinase